MKRALFMIFILFSSLLFFVFAADYNNYLEGNYFEIEDENGDTIYVHFQPVVDENGKAQEGLYRLMQGKSGGYIFGSMDRADGATIDSDGSVIQISGSADVEKALNELTSGQRSYTLKRGGSKTVRGVVVDYDVPNEQYKPYYLSSSSSTGVQSSAVEVTNLNSYKSGSIFSWDGYISSVKNGESTLEGYWTDDQKAAFKENLVKMLKRGDLSYEEADEIYNEYKQTVEGEKSKPTASVNGMDVEEYVSSEVCYLS